MCQVCCFPSEDYFLIILLQYFLASIFPDLLMFVHCHFGYDLMVAGRQLLSQSLLVVNMEY